MTDIGVYTQPFQSEDLSWDLSSPGVPYVESGTLDVSLFTQPQHFPNGYIPSGTVLAVKTATGLLGPYLDASGVAGLSTAVGVLRHSVQVVQPNGSLKAKLGVAVLKAFGVFRIPRAPFTSTNAAAGGYIDANGQADLPRIHFVTA